MRNRLVLTVVTVILVLSAVAVPMYSSEAVDGGTDVLIDHGNGDTEWTVSQGETVWDILLDASRSLGHEIAEFEGIISLDGRGPVTIGSSSTGGDLETAGATGATIETSWHVFGWDGGWVEIDITGSASDYAAIAVAFYPDGVVPVVTPDDKYAWVMSRGDSSNSSSQTYTGDTGTGDYEVSWSERGTAHASMLYANGYVFQKYGIDTSGYAKVVCINADTGDHVWEFSFLSASNYESSTPLIVGENIYIATMTGYIYGMPWKTGPGEGNADVFSIGGTGFNDAVPVESVIKDFDVGTTYDSGFSSMTYDSGAIYVTHSNGMIYCFNLGLNLVWSYMCGGSTYLVSPTVVDNMVFSGALDGNLYILDAKDGSELVNRTIYQVTYRDRVYGNVGQVAVLKNDSGNYGLIFTVSDGLGMSQRNSGLAVYEFSLSGNTLVERYFSADLGVMGRFVTPVTTNDFNGAYVLISDGIETGMYRISTDGVLELMTSGLAEIHSPMSLVNGQYLYMVSYSSNEPLYQISLDGEIVGTATCDALVRDFNMTPVLAVGDRLFAGTDSGIYAIQGSFNPFVPPSNDQGQPVILVIAEILAAIIGALAVVYAILRFGKGIEKPYKYLSETFLHYLYGEDYSHNTRNKHRLKFIVIIGIILVLVVFTLCLCIGSTSIVNPVEAYSALFSAISKGGVGLDTLETTIYVSRLPRTIAAIAVGIGLSVAGCIYQAIIRNPLVDPYIMGVSSGAGVAAIAVIAFDFTFFGLFSSHSIFLTAITACVGGLIAFGCTMLLAEKAGGSAINYVLSGVVIGLAFSAVQTLMLTMAGNKLSNALTWLYGSFAEVTWSQVGIILFLSVFLSLVPLLWAKELNLVLLGEDQARQMGLDVRRFNRWMLILASVLTSVCVAFCGVIGFVGLVIPHLCRMLLGSDHRMVLPASICFGGVMLMLADLLARTGYYGMELPVGAITTVIGIPVFAYLLIKRGRMYDG